MDTPGRILVLGASGVGKHDLLQSIRGQETLRHAESSYAWRLDNKYYTADVKFDVKHVERCESLHLESAGYQAVVIVFDAGQQASFESVQRWYEAAGGAVAELAVRLAVGTRADSLPRDAHGDAAKPRWLVAAEEWCTEQLVEYVETCNVTGRQQPTQEAAASWDRGREGASGVQRIKEALEAHMWPGLRLKPSPRHGLASAAAESRMQEASQPEVEEAAPLPNGANGVHSSSDSASLDAAQDLDFAHYLRDAGEALAAAGNANGQALGKEEMGIEEVDHMAQLLSQMTSHRSQLSQLPDAQRREAATSMLMRLMEVMGLDKEEDEEGEAEEAVVAAAE